jgi:hypothetical protein
MQQILEAALQDRSLKLGLEYIGMLDAESNDIKKKPELVNSPLGKALIRDIEGVRAMAIDSVGKKGKTRIERLQEELRDLSNRALDIEIETTEKYAQNLTLKEQDPTAILEFEREIGNVMAADDEHLFWTFDGEYWRDELGYYWYHMYSRCGR